MSLKGLKPDRLSTRMAKKAMIAAMRSQMGLITQSCKIAGIERRTYFRWYEGDPVFKMEIDDLENSVVDFVEGKLYELVNEKNIVAIKFFLENKAKQYRFKAQIEHSGTLKINANIDFTKLSKEQLLAIAAGESVGGVGTSEEGRAGAS